MTSTLLKGTDVSGYQGTTVPDGDFCIIKLTEGTGYVNSKAEKQVASARAKGQLVGFYHFPKYGQDPTANVLYFLSVLGRYYRVGDSVWFDNETYPEPSVSQVNTWNQKFMTELDKRLAFTPGVYSNISWAKSRSVGLGKYPWWKAWPNSTASFTGAGVFSKAVMHQYAETGGIDRNFFNGTKADWLSMWTPKAATPTGEESMYGGYVPAGTTRQISYPHGALKIVGLTNSTDVPCSVDVEVNHKDDQTSEKVTLTVGGARLAKGGWKKETYSFKNAKDGDALAITNHGTQEIGWDAS